MFDFHNYKLYICETRLKTHNYSLFDLIKVFILYVKPEIKIYILIYKHTQHGMAQK